jgi:hypothetical protein
MDLKDAATAFTDENGQRISAGIYFDVATKTVKLHGTANATNKAKTQLEESLREVLKPISAQNRSNAFTDTHYAPKHFDRLNARSLKSRNFDVVSPKIFPLQTTEDSQSVETWSKYILPRLASILFPSVGGDYSATLVRQGESESSSAPAIRIQSASGQSEQIRTKIRRDIDQICDEHNRNRIGVYFSMGRLMFLGGSSEKGSSNAAAQMEDEDENDDGEFPHHRRYWRFPGMGASIGMLCSKSVSATLGGYILVDHKRYLLTVDHFIQESERATDFQRISGDMAWKLTSPSLADVEDMSANLDQTLRDMRAKIEEHMQQSHLDGTQISDPDLKSFGDHYTAFCRFRKELARKDTDFVLGKVDYRCVPKARESNSSAAITLSETNIFHRMDWSLCRVDLERTGDNRPRYRFPSQTDIVDFLNEGATPKGAGILCTETCEVEKHALVHYVGQRSGRVSARVNGVLMLHSCNGNATQEWTLLPSTQKSGHEIYAGDSGAWIINDSTGQVMGMLWGWQDHHLLFTPFTDILKDIRDLLSAKEIHLPDSSISPKPVDGHVFVSRSNKPKSRKVKGYRWKASNYSLPPLEETVKRPTSITLRTDRSTNEASLPFHQRGATVETETGSPVPSLSLSTTSSPRSPSSCSSSSEMLGKKSFDTNLEPLTSFDGCVVIRGDSETEDSATIVEVTPLSIPAHEHHKVIPRDSIDTQNKHSVGYIISVV